MHAHTQKWLAISCLALHSLLVVAHAIALSLWATNIEHRYVAAPSQMETINVYISVISQVIIVVCTCCS